MLGKTSGDKDVSARRQQKFQTVAKGTRHAGEKVKATNHLATHRWIEIGQFKVLELAVHA